LCHCADITVLPERLILSIGHLSGPPLYQRLHWLPSYENLIYRTGKYIALFQHSNLFLQYPQGKISQVADIPILYGERLCGQGQSSVGPAVNLDNSKSVLNVNIENIRDLDLHSVEPQLNLTSLKDNFIGRALLYASFWLKFLPYID
jgi:hypothetical protein